jgi:hypothetical protein
MNKFEAFEEAYGWASDGFTRVEITRVYSISHTEAYSVEVFLRGSEFGVFMREIFSDDGVEYFFH